MTRHPLPRPSLDEVNAILGLFRAGETIRLEQDARTLRLVTPRSTDPRNGVRRVRAHVREDGLWLRDHRAAHRYASLGGTEEQALAQLILWYRGRFRKPVGWWKGWTGYLVQLGRPGLYETLLASSYNDPARTCCCLCGHPEPRDWWSHGRRVGPCCRGAFDGACPK